MIHQDSFAETSKTSSANPYGPPKNQNWNDDDPNAPHPYHKGKGKGRGKGKKGKRAANVIPQARAGGTHHTARQPQPRCVGA